MTREEAINILWMYDVSFEPHPAEEVMHAIDMAIEALRQPERKTGRWIPVTERLPKKSGLYLVTEKALGKIEICTRYFNARADESFWSGWEYTVVLAWQPLPEPYKEDPCNGCGYLGESCVGEGCGKLAEREECDGNG